MRTSFLASSAMSLASLSAGTGLPMLGPCPPTFEVVKKVASIVSKSRSSRIRSINTEPTMPRQPMNPTVVMFVLPKCELDTGLRRYVVAPADAGAQFRGIFRSREAAASRASLRVGLERFNHRRAHLCGGGGFRAFGGDIRGAQAGSQRGADGLLDPPGDVGAGERVA